MAKFLGYKKKFESIVAVYNIARKAFDEPLPLSRTFGGPQNFKEAFIDEMESNRDNLFSSFHPTREFSYDLILQMIIKSNYDVITSPF